MLSLGCGSGNISRVQFNDTLVKLIRDLFLQSREMRGAFVSVDSTKSFAQENVDKLKAANAKLGNTLSRAKNDVDNLPLPRSNAAAEYRDKFKAFLQVEQGIYDKLFQEIISIAEGPGASADKAARVDQVFKQIEAEEKKPLEDLQAAQNKFAEEYNFKLTPRYKDAGAK